MTDHADPSDVFAVQVAERVADPGRLEAVAATGLLDSAADAAFDRIAAIAARLLDAPFGFITVVDDTRSFWKACIGIQATDPRDRQNAVEESFCQYVIGLDDELLVDDTRLDARTADNPSIESMGVLAWAGVPLRAARGEVLGTLCVVDTRTRSWTADDAELLRDLSAIVVDEIASAQVARAAARSEALLSAVLSNAPIGFALVDDQYRYEIVNDTLAAINGVAADTHVGRTVREVLPDVADSVEPLLRSVLTTGEPAVGIEIVGSTPAEPSVERVWTSSYYRLEVGERSRVGLFVEEITAAVRSRRRAARLASISGSLARADTLQEVERIVAHEIGDYFDASMAVVGHWDPDAGTTTVLATPSVRDAMEESGHLTGEHAPYADAVRTLRTVTIAHPGDRVDDVLAGARPGEVVAEAFVPCVTGGGTFTGVMWIGWNERRRADDFPLPQLETVAGILAGVFERNRLHRQRRQLIDTLQQSLLDEPPERPGVEIVARYRPAGDALGFGGDWYDVIGLGDDRTALVVGDVAGHDPTAAARMSQISSIIAQLLLSGTPLSVLFSAAERAMAARSITAMATVNVVVIDPRSRTLTSISAGHLPALLLTPDGDVEWLERALRPPLWTLGADVHPTA
ncbi:MAG: SpoIIE family protein phosphatase, partial [Ilumatobacter sp.]